MVCGCVLGIEIESLVVVRDGAIEIAHEAICLAAGGVDDGLSWIQFNAFRQIGDRPTEVSLLRVGATAKVVSARKLALVAAVLSDRFGTALNSQIEIGFAGTVGERVRPCCPRYDTKGNTDGRYARIHGQPPLCTASYQLACAMFMPARDAVNHLQKAWTALARDGKGRTATQPSCSHLL